MQAIQLVENEKESEFYPTPDSVVNKMLDGVEWYYIRTVLEPSAGKGNILKRIAQKESLYQFSLDIDCIEIDANLRQVLKYEFSDEKKMKLKSRKAELEKNRKYNCNTHRYDELPKEQKQELKSIKESLLEMFNNGIHVVHDDFLTYIPYKRYDLIVMNPPFSNGDKHLLKALEMQQKGGSIICLLNAETLRNPYTDTRKKLLKKLDKYGAKIDFIDGGFSTAERKTDVEVALIKVSIEKVQEESDIYKRFEEAAKLEDFNPEVTDIEVTDYIKSAVNMFNVEVKAGLELIRQYRAMLPYMRKGFEKDGDSPILRLTDSNDRGYNSVSVNDYLKAVRLKYWRELLSNEKFTSRLTTKLQTEYREKVETLSDYDFSEFNIYTLSAEMNSQIKTGIEEEIVIMFDKLTAEHSYYPECVNNRHYFDGWKTNKAHKIGKKVILPCCSAYSTWSGSLSTRDAYEHVCDIERILNFLDGNMSAEVDAWKQIDDSFKEGITKNIQLKYFKATFYKKGTMHIVFDCPELIDRFNIYAAKNKQWLPPCYGRKTYKGMSAEEKAVVDSFQGEKAYNKILEKANYYLAPVTNGSIMMIEQSE